MATNILDILKMTQAAPPDPALTESTRIARDRITEILNRSAKSDIQRAGDALNAAYGKGTFYGDEFRAGETADIERAFGIMKLLQGERQLGLQEQTLQRQNTLTGLQIYQALQKQKPDLAKIVELYAGDNLENRAKLAEALHTDPAQITADNVHAKASAAARMLGITGREKTPSPTVVAPGSTAIGPDGKPIYTAPPKPETNTAVNFMLPDKRVVLSYDGGRTYTDPANGQSLALPPNSVRMGIESGVEAARQAELQRRAQGEIGAPALPRPDASGAASGQGVGPISNLAAAIDATVGPFVPEEFMRKFGRDGTLFPDTQANRQTLRTIKQLAKPALVNNPRFPVAEQANVDKLFPNPDAFWGNPSTEAKKLAALRQTLSDYKRINNEMIASGGLPPTEVSKLVANNVEIDRALSLMGTPQATQPPQGVDPRLWKYMTPEERALWK